MKLLTCLFLFAALGACRTAAPQPIPDAPPEAADWARPRASEDGAYLGLATRENDSGTLDDLFFEAGVRVARVDPHSPADAAGIRVGDVVLSFDGAELLEPESLEALIAQSVANAEVTLEVRRDDTVFEVPVRLRAKTGSDAGEVVVQSRVDPVRSRARWRTETNGVRLYAAADDAPFPAAGVPVGAIVTALDARPVASAREWIRLLLAEEPGATVQVTWIDAGGATHESAVRLFDISREVTGFKIPILTHYERDFDADTTSFVLVDLYVISLFRYTREGQEKEWRFLRWFRTSTGIGELSE
jgi:C-terminal processing protease CtpA/Prc